MPLYWRLLLSTAATTLVAFVVLLVSPIKISAQPTAQQAAWLALFLLGVVILNAAFIGQALGPLAAVRDALDTVEGPESATPLVQGGPEEIAEISGAYNAMLRRLDSERAASMRAALRAQEEERARIARELHDEVGQTMTFLLLRMASVSKSAPAELQGDLGEVTDAVRSALDEIRSISRRLGPDALGDLGIAAALESLAQDAAALSGLQIEFTAGVDLAPDRDRDLTLYRVAQEALTNVVKHAQASSVAMVLALGAPGRVVLTLTDDGVGPSGRDGTGTYSMRERARLVGGTFHRGAGPSGGTRVLLDLPERTAAGGVVDEPTRPIPTTTVFPPSAFDPRGRLTLGPPARTSAATPDGRAEEQSGKGEATAR